MNPGFLVLEILALTRGQLAAINALGDALLLVFRALALDALRIRILHSGIMLVLVNLVGQLVLLLVQGSAVGLGQVAVVHRLHITLFLVQLRFLLLQAASFAGSELSIGDAVGNTALLNIFALLNPTGDLRARGRSGGRRRSICCRWSIRRGWSACGRGSASRRRSARVRWRVRSLGRGG